MVQLVSTASSRSCQLDGNDLQPVSNTPSMELSSLIASMICCKQGFSVQLLAQIPQVTAHYLTCLMRSSPILFNGALLVRVFRIAAYVGGVPPACHQSSAIHFHQSSPRSWDQKKIGLKKLLFQSSTTTYCSYSSTLRRLIALWCFMFLLLSWVGKRNQLCSQHTKCLIVRELIQQATTQQGAAVWGQQVRQNCPIIVHGKALHLPCATVPLMGQLNSQFWREGGCRRRRRQEELGRGWQAGWHVSVPRPSGPNLGCLSSSALRLLHSYTVPLLHSRRRTKEPIGEALEHPKTVLDSAQVHQPCYSRTVQILHSQTSLCSQEKVTTTRHKKEILPIRTDVSSRLAQRAMQQAYHKLSAVY